ncbi:hypothetical protein TNCV_313301 [Trichonephila clavipes]|nr:hypothetical protein TNCV_313301 [Trichonephila clavipes]
MATPGSSFTPIPLGHEDNLEVRHRKKHVMLVRVREDQALSVKCVNEWFARFRESRESVPDKTRSGRPATSVSDENIEKMRKLITKDLRLTGA